MTTSHAGDSIRETLSFATSLAVPDPAFSTTCRTVVVALVGNLAWHDEARSCLGNLLVV